MPAPIQLTPYGKVHTSPPILSCLKSSNIQSHLTNISKGGPRLRVHPSFWCYVQVGGCMTGYIHWVGLSYSVIHGDELGQANPASASCSVPWCIILQKLREMILSPSPFLFVATFQNEDQIFKISRGLYLW
eukprot:TRINITY_DN13286_c0_g1_i1.p1 TRINITY_DN13286_c0_g1~~TRINITY_DN13286_c0_g1_i1.p1  ORF type:complete len:131 (-),score=0.18 TRINITY_DN13286_c0_g1_i1:160-552(-)